MLVGFVLLLALAAGSVSAECNGFIFVTKGDNTPVYQESRSSSLVRRVLKGGEKVCYVGKQGDYAIITDEKSGKLEFVLDTDLYPPEGYGRPSDRSPYQKVKDYYHFIASGGVPEDPLSIFRPILEVLEGLGVKSEPSKGSENKK